MKKNFSSKPRICVDIRQIHTSGPPRSNVKKYRKTFTTADNLKKKIKVNLFWIKKLFVYLIQMTQTNEQPNDKTLFNVFLGKNI